MAVPKDTNDTAFEREKWRAELQLRKRELDAKLEEQQRARWTNPLVLAVFAAALAAGGNAVVALINGSSQRTLEETRSNAQLELEERKSNAQLALELKKYEGQQAIEEAKAEAARILEMIKTDDPEKAAVNLDFLLKAGLITGKQRQADLRQFLKDRQPGQGPSLPSASPRIPSGLPNYNLPLPAKDPLQTNTAYRLLELAVGEINKNIYEGGPVQPIL